MIQLVESRLDVPGIVEGAIWIGNSGMEYQPTEVYRAQKVDGLLNVAVDLTCTHGWWEGIHTCQVGLIDGPGNELSAYASAMLALRTLLKTRNTLVVCHTGTRAMAVVVMYQAVMASCAWDEALTTLRERVEDDLPVPLLIHKENFERLNHKAIKALLK